MELRGNCGCLTRQLVVLEELLDLGAPVLPQRDVVPCPGRPQEYILALSWDAIGSPQRVRSMLLPICVLCHSTYRLSILESIGDDRRLTPDLATILDTHVS